MTLFEAAKQVSCNEAAQRLGLRGSRSGNGRGRWSCPMHRDNTPSMWCYDDKNNFHCFSCGRHGDATDLYAMAMGLSAFEAARQVCEDFGLVWERVRTKPEEWQPPREPSDAARNIISLCKAWKSLAMKVAWEEMDRAAQRLDELKTPEHPGWNANLMLAVQFQDEYNRYRCMEVCDLLETMKDEMVYPEEEQA